MSRTSRFASTKLACFVAFAALSVLSACSKSTKSKKEPSEEDLLAEAQDDLKAVNDAIPASLRGELRFVAKVDGDGRNVILAPKNWEENKIMKGQFEPEGGRPTSYKTGTNCDGFCKSKSAAEWEKIARKVDRVGDAKTDKVEELPDGVVVTRDDKWAGDVGKVVTVLRWKEDASHYMTCRAFLTGKWAEAAPAFEKACRAMRPIRWD